MSKMLTMGVAGAGGFLAGRSFPILAVILIPYAIYCIISWMLRHWIITLVAVFIFMGLNTIAQNSPSAIARNDIQRQVAAATIVTGAIDNRLPGVETVIGSDDRILRPRITMRNPTSATLVIRMASCEGKTERRGYITDWTERFRGTRVRPGESITATLRLAAEYAITDVQCRFTYDIEH